MASPMQRDAFQTIHFQPVPIGPTRSVRLIRHSGHNFPIYLHYHPEMELTLFRKGRGMRFVGDSIQPFGPGDLCLLGANLVHTWHTDEKPPSTEIIFAQVRPELLAGAAELSPEFRRLRDLPGLCSRGVQITGPQAQTVTRLLVEAAEAPDGSDRRFTAVLLALNAACDSAGHQTLATTPPAPPQTDSSLSRLRRVIESLHAHMPNPPGQAAMARLAGLTPAGFSCFFKRAVGRSYVDYVNSWRIGLACRQLMQTDLPITTIAFDCGFENLSNFRRRFRQYKQTTPREYRAAAMLRHPSCTEVPAPLTEDRKGALAEHGAPHT